MYLFCSAYFCVLKLIVIRTCIIRKSRLHNIVHRVKKELSCTYEKENRTYFECTLLRYCFRYFFNCYLLVRVSFYCYDTSKFNIHKSIVVLQCIYTQKKKKHSKMFFIIRSITTDISTENLPTVDIFFI